LGRAAAIAGRMSANSDDHDSMAVLVLYHLINWFSLIQVAFSIYLILTQSCFYLNVVLGPLPGSPTVP
jgi:hypothetical protein